MFGRKQETGSGSEQYNPMKDLIEFEHAVFNDGYQDRLKAVYDNLLQDNNGNVVLKQNLDALTPQDWKQMGPSLEATLRAIYKEIDAK